MRTENAVSQKRLIFRGRAHRRTFALSELSRPGGAAKILPPRRAKRCAHAPVFVGGLPRTPSQLSRFTGVARPPPLKPRFRYYRAGETITVKTGVLKGVVARSVRRCAAVDSGGFDAASSEDIAPMLPAVRASSQDRRKHVVARQTGVSRD